MLSRIDRKSLIERVNRNRPLIEGHAEVRDACGRFEGHVRDPLKKLFDADTRDAHHAGIALFEAKLQGALRAFQRIHQLACTRLARGEMKPRPRGILDLDGLPVFGDALVKAPLLIGLERLADELKRRRNAFGWLLGTDVVVLELVGN